MQAESRALLGPCEGLPRLRFLTSLWYAPPCRFDERRSGRPRGGVVTQRTANPCTPVRFRARPPSKKPAGEAGFFVVAERALGALPKPPPVAVRSRRAGCPQRVNRAATALVTGYAAAAP